GLYIKAADAHQPHPFQKGPSGPPRDRDPGRGRVAGPGIDHAQTRPAPRTRGGSAQRRADLSEALRQLPRRQGRGRQGVPRTPHGENVALEEYSVRWSGGLFAPESGDYEIILETRNGARLWMNDDATPLVDGWVRSGDNVVLKETIPLLGGRVYPLRIEIFKEK